MKLPGRDGAPGAIVTLINSYLMDINKYRALRLAASRIGDKRK